MDRNVVEEFKISSENAKECVEEDIVHKGEKRRIDPEWMHVIEVDSVESGLQIGNADVNLILE